MTEIPLCAFPSTERLHSISNFFPSLMVWNDTAKGVIKSVITQLQKRLDEYIPIKKRTK